MDAQVDRLTLFPKIDPFGEGMLSLDGNHVMYWEQSGNPNGMAVGRKGSPARRISVFAGTR